MNCADFQKVLPYIIDTGGDPEHKDHLSTCSGCAELVSDLQYIADQAKLLVPMIEPSPRVWEEIQDSLKSEGLVRPKRARGKVLKPNAANRAGPTRILSAIALLLLGLCLYAYRTRLDAKLTAAHPVRTTPVSNVSPATAARGDRANGDDDQKLLASLSAVHPERRASYEAGLRAVNQSISDARQWAEQHPFDPEVRAFLNRAYQQKALIYGLGQQHSIR
jgi:hypothetical protein